jgi:N-carbamoylputrescine amidase
MADSKRIRVAAIQIKSKLGQPEENIRHAIPYIEQAARENAQLVTLSEMCIPGYTLTRQVWQNSEPIGGSSERWLSDTARRLGIHLCAGLTQFEGEDFYNTYLVADPEGTIVGRVRKTQTEVAIHMAGSLDSHIFDTSLGQIGVGICSDNHMVSFARLMREKNIDLLLMPHASPIPYRTSNLIKESDISEAEGKVRDFAKFYAGLFGIPTVLVNQVGGIEGERWPGITGRLVIPEYFNYPGYSTIVDSDIVVVAQLQRQEGVIVADVTLDPTRKRCAPIPDYGGWIHPGSAIFRKIILAIDISWGKLHYRLGGGTRRKIVARRM